MAITGTPVETIRVSEHVRFKHPDLIEVMLTEYLGFSFGGHFEKLRWSVGFLYKNTAYYLSHRKFGLRLEVFSKAGLEHVSELLKKLDKSTKYALAHLEKLDSQRLEQASVTLSNRGNFYRERYRHFRDGASTFYETEAPPPTVKKTEWFTLTTFNDPYPKLASYEAWAAFSAYFASLDHWFILALAFTEFDPENGELLRVLSTEWDVKFRILFDLTEDETHKLYTELKKVKDRRNAETHGGFEKGGATFLIHSPFGARSQERRRVKETGWIGETEFREACAAFDQVDKLFRERFPFAHRFIESGLDVSFSISSREMYRSAATSMEEFEHFIKALERWEDDHTNMDY